MSMQQPANPQPSRLLQCPINGCQQAKQSRQHVLCHHHWQLLPVQTQEQLSRLLRTAPQSDSCQMAVQAAIEDVANQEAFSQV